jgi:excisionase family DNA binding protein
MIELQDKLYTSTEVADILGVSLRSVYRYIEEKKLHAEVKTATGRHRFTKQDILNFLYPDGEKKVAPEVSAPSAEGIPEETPLHPAPEATALVSADTAPVAVVAEEPSAETEEASPEVAPAEGAAETAEVPAVESAASLAADGAVASGTAAPTEEGAASVSATETPSAEETPASPAAQEEPVAVEQPPVAEEPSKEAPVADVPSEESVDWLAKFREAAKKFQEENSAAVTESASDEKPADVAPVEEAPVVTKKPAAPVAAPVKEAPVATKKPAASVAAPVKEVPVAPEKPAAPIVPAAPTEKPAAATPAAPAPKVEDITGLGAPEASAPVEVVEAPPEETPPEETVEPEDNMWYYTSALGGLKNIAQGVDKNARDAQVSYAFTLQAGLSLHSPIKPFSLLHAYIRAEDRKHFEESLQLKVATESDAQLCLVVTDDMSIFSSSEELHGLYVVSKEQLASDIAEVGEASLREESSKVL